MKSFLFLIIAISTAAIITSCVDDGGVEDPVLKSIPRFNISIDNDTDGLYAGIEYNIKYDIRANYDIDNISFVELSAGGCTATLGTSTSGNYIATVTPQTTPCTITMAVADQQNPSIKKTATLTVAADKTVDYVLAFAPTYHKYVIPGVDVPLSLYRNTATTTSGLYSDLTALICETSAVAPVYVKGLLGAKGRCTTEYKGIKTSDSSEVATTVSIDIVPPSDNVTIDIDDDNIIDRLYKEDFEAVLNYVPTGAVTYEWFVDNSCGTLETKNSKKVEFHSTFRAMTDCKVKAVVKNDNNTYIAEKSFSIK